MRMQRGFTLIELMIVVAVLGIIAAIAFPSYLEHVRAGKRGEAMSGVGDLQMRQESYRAEHTAYGDKTQIGGDPANTTHYSYTVVGGATYTITATPNYTEPCGNLVVTNTTKPTWNPGGAGCN